jgi:hypothetical protein
MSAGRNIADEHSWNSPAENNIVLRRPKPRIEARKAMGTRCSVAFAPDIWKDVRGGLQVAVTPIEHNSRGSHKNGKRNFMADSCIAVLEDEGSDADVCVGTQVHFFGSRHLNRG